ncbi:MAG: succinyl-diaminopimelate desuccinylase [Anaeromyxobacteraceae bacterium]
MATELELAARTEALCRTMSVIGSEAALCGEVEAWARARFPLVTRVGDSLVVRVDGPPGGRGPTIALCGHLDTVPVHEADLGPPRRDGGRLVAPGASDMKGGLAVMMALAEELPRDRRFCDLVLVFYAREEGPYAENELGDLLLRPGLLSGLDLALCLEPTDNGLQLGCVGSMHATFTFEGRAAHSARPWQGENAVHRAGGLLAALHARTPRDVVSGGLLYREVLSCTRIEGGRARNVVPDRCALNLNFRFAPDRTVEDAEAELRALAAEHGARIEVTDRSPACPAFADHPLVRRLAERGRLSESAKQAWTDVARLAAHGIPAANLGPGATAQAHQQGEWIETAALARCFEAYAAFLAR